MKPVHRGSFESPSSAWPNFSPDPYVDYARVLTPEGGIKIVYKDLDERLRHTLRRLLLWSCATALEGWILLVTSLRAIYGSISPASSSSE